MKVSYLCTIDDEERRSAVGSEKLFSGLTKFAACPGRKKSKPDRRKRVKSTLSLKFLNFYNIMAIKAAECKLKFTKNEYVERGKKK